MNICIKTFSHWFLAADPEGTLWLYAAHPKRGPECWLSEAQQVALTDTEADAIKQRFNISQISWTDEPRIIEVVTSIQPL